MPLIPPHLREQIRSASDIVEIIGAYVPLKRAGANFVALCPFHREKTPSFHVNPSRQSFHCFGCQKGGDVFRFLQDYENLTYVEAIRRLADRAGIRLEFDDAPGAREQRAVQDQLRELHEQLTQRWQQVLATDAAGEPARAYVTQRGVPAEAIQNFRLGFAPPSWDDTVHWARSRKWDLKLVADAGLIVQRDAADASRGYYDRFRDRLIFPIADEQGRVIGFSGRLLDPDAKAAKYVNSPETAIFHKSRVLYGLDKTKRAILDQGSVLICEGQLDLIACHQAGVRNVVAPQGTALTPDHLRILRRYCQEAVLCFDSDAAGQKAAARVLDDLLGSGLSLRVVTVPAPHDPDSYIRAHGAEAFQQLVASARDFFEFYLEFLCQQKDVATDGGRVSVLDAMAAALARTSNELLIDRHAQRTAMALAAAGRVALSPDAVRAEFRKRIARASATAAQAPRDIREPSPDSEAVEIAPPPPVPPAEAWLLKLLFLNDDFPGWLALHLDPVWIQNPHVRTIVERRLHLQLTGEWQSAADFLGECEDPLLRRLVSEALADPRPIPQPEVQLADLTLRLRNADLDRQIARLSLSLGQSSLPEDQRTAGLHQLQELRRTRRSPLPTRLT
jgi:DNA primase